MGHRLHRWACERAAGGTELKHHAALEAAVADLPRSSGTSMGSAVMTLSAVKLVEMTALDAITLDELDRTRRGLAEATVDLTPIVEMQHDALLALD